MRKFVDISIGQTNTHVIIKMLWKRESLFWTDCEKKTFLRLPIIFVQKYENDCCQNLFF
jgi:hypothetical protein